MNSLKQCSKIFKFLEQDGRSTFTYNFKGEWYSKVVYKHPFGIPEPSRIGEWIQGRGPLLWHEPEKMDMHTHAHTHTLMQAHTEGSVVVVAERT